MKGRQVTLLLYRDSVSFTLPDANTTTEQPRSASQCLPTHRIAEAARSCGKAPTVQLRGQRGRAVEACGRWNDGRPNGRCGGAIR